MTIETTVVNTAKQVLLNVTNHITNHVLPNDTVNVSVQTGEHWLIGVGTLIATIALAGGTLWLAWSNHRSNTHTRKITIESNNTTKEALLLSKTEYYEKMKPLLVVEKYKFREAFEENNPNDYHSGIHIYVLNCVIRNKGFSSARNVMMRYANTNNLDIKEIIKGFDPRYKGDFQATVPSNGTLMIIRTVSTEHGINLAIWLKFDYLKDQKGQCLIILPISKAQLPIVWYDDYDIEEAEKLEKDFRDGKIHSP